MTKLFYIDTEVVAYLGEVMTNHSMTVEETLNSLDLDLNDVAKIVDCDVDELDYNALKLTDFDQIVDNALDNQKYWEIAVDAYNIEDAREFEKLSGYVYDAYVDGFEQGNESGKYITVEHYLEEEKRRNNDVRSWNESEEEFQRYLDEQENQ